MSRILSPEKVASIERAAQETAARGPGAWLFEPEQDVLALIATLRAAWAERDAAVARAEMAERDANESNRERDELRTERDAARKG